MNALGCGECFIDSCGARVVLEIGELVGPALSSCLGNIVEVFDLRIFVEKNF